MADIKDPENTLLLETSKGPVVIEMRPDLAPGHVARIKELARQGFYDGLKFHRVIDGFMAQTGCPQGTGTGGSGKKLKAEFSPEKHVRGTVSMARSQRSEFRRQPVLHLLRRGAASEQAVHGVGPGDRRHGEHRRDQQGRAAEGARHDRLRCGSPPTPPETKAGFTAFRVRTGRRPPQDFITNDDRCPALAL